jgi:hypothetical protein
MPDVIKIVQGLLIYFADPVGVKVFNNNTRTIQLTPPQLPQASCNMTNGSVIIATKLRAPEK